MKRNSTSKKTNNTGVFLVSFLLVFIISFTILFIIEKKVRDIQFEEIKSNENTIIELENEFLGKELRAILSDLNYLKLTFEKNIEENIDISNAEYNWVVFSTQRNIYDQIRYIDENGDEKIRVNLGKDGAYEVSYDELQNKKDRYYFFETMKQKNNDVYISPLDLNIEHSEIEMPFKPMIRFSTPVYNADGDQKGMIILNYLARNVLTSFKNLAKSSKGELSLLNSNGFWLSNPDESLEWSFMFEDRKDVSFKNIYSEEWKSIIKGQGQVITDKGLFTYAPIDLQTKILTENGGGGDQQVELGDGTWTIVSFVPRDGVHSSLFIKSITELTIDVIEKNRIYFVLMLIISGSIALLIFLNRRTFSKIKYFSEFDTMTKTLNRRAGLEKLAAMIPADDRRNILLSLCFIDVNGLKQVNDILGHEAGDELIITVTNSIKSMIRENDLIIRLGGDEFLIVFSGMEAKQAENIWDRIIDLFNEINEKENRKYIVSVSHGIIDYEKTKRSELDDLIKTADEKMYIEKGIMKENLSVIRWA